LRVSLSNLGDEFLQDYSLVKKIENNFINETIEGNVIYQDEKQKYLIESTINGYTQETGTLTKPCGDEIYTRDIKLSHKEGTFNLQKCRADKKIKFNTPLDCVAEGEINIFDYSASETETIQGVIDTDSHSEVVLAFLEEGTNTLYNFNINYLLSFLQPIPDKSNEGYFERLKQLFVIAGPIGGQFQIVLQVGYIRNRSSIQHTDKWVQIQGETDYYLPFAPIQWEAAKYDYFLDTGNNNQLFTWVTYKAGQFINYQHVSISNTVNFNEVLTGLFECTGYNVVSNFFGINPDASNPINKYYQFASVNYHDLRIVQSYDIIRENELDDSFGRSGIIKNKDLITDLCTLFNLLIFPEVGTTTIRIEHVSYYTTKGIDITTLEYELNDFQLNVDEIDKETWQMAAETPTDGFYDVSIEYRNLDLFKAENEKIEKSKLIITDVFGTLNNEKYEDDNYKKLFYLLATDGSSIVELNNSLSIKSLFENLHDLNRPLKSGFIDGLPVEFGGYSIGLSSDIKIKSSVLMWNNLIPMYSVITKFGTFLIEEITIDKNDLLTIKIKK